MNLGKQIDSLLKRQTSVYVKGLGVFRRVHTSATFDSKRKVFLPPISFIEFDHFSTEGYDFIAHLQQVEQIEYNQAEEKLNAAVQGIVYAVNNVGEVTLDDLGSLMPYGDSYIFKPLDLSGFLYAAVEDEYYELGNTSKEEHVNEVEEAIVDNVATQPIESSSSINAAEEQKIENKPIIPEVVPVVSNEAINNEDEKESIALEEVDIPVAKPERNNGYIYGLIAVFAILALGGIYYYATFYQDNTKIAVPVVAEIPLVDSSLLKIDTAEQLPLDTVMIAQDTALVHEELVVENKPAKEEIVNHKYIIIIGTHPTLESAEAEAAAYNKKGFKTVRVLEPNLSKNEKRVIWDAYPTSEKRDSALVVVRKNYKADAWPSVIN